MAEDAAGAAVHDFGQGEGSPFRVSGDPPPCSAASPKMLVLALGAGPPRPPGVRKGPEERS